MIYIYDIILNFNQEFYEFYEWEKKDNLFLVKKIPLYKVETKVLDDLLTKKIKFDDPIVLEINNKCEVIDHKKTKKIKYAALFTDSYRVVALNLNDKFEISKISDLLLDEAYNILNISKRCNLVFPAYNIIGSNKNEYFLTRNELKIKKYLLTELKKINLEHDKEKLRYLYFEYFNKTPSNDINIYDELLNSITLDMNKEQLRLYELLKLIHQ